MSGYDDMDAYARFAELCLRKQWSWATMVAAAQDPTLEVEMPRERFHHHARHPIAPGGPGRTSAASTELPHEHHEGAVHVTHVSQGGRRHVTRIPLADYNDQAIAAARTAAERHFANLE